MATPHHDHIETAFHQLSFAIKLDTFLETHPIQKENFDISLTIDDGDNVVCLEEGEFQTYTDLQIAAENNISICFGAASITLWEAIREHTGRDAGTLKPNSNTADNLAALSYMIRCCFAHGSAQPMWSIGAKYQTQYRVGNKTIDLSQIVKGQPFDYVSIGGYETLWQLKLDARINGLL